MKRKVINDNGRDKAFLGSIIGGVANTIGGFIGKRKQKKAQEEAFRQQQAEQTRQEGVQQAAAMSSSYANQDYVGDYQKKISLKNGGKVKTSKGYTDRLAHAKKFKCGGRKKAGLGSFLSGQFKSIGNEFKGENLGNTLTGIMGGVNNAINGGQNNTPQQPAISTTDVTTMNNAAENRRIAQAADEKRYEKRCGGRQKAMFGIGEAIGGVGNMLGNIFSKPEMPKTIKKADGFSFQAPKTGMKQNDYQTDENGNPITAMNNNAVPTNPAQQPNPEYRDRLTTARLGTKRRAIRR